MWVSQGQSLLWGCPVCCEGGCIWGSGAAVQGQQVHSSVERLQSLQTHHSPHPAGRSSLGLQHQGRTHSGGHFEHPGWSSMRLGSALTNNLNIQSNSTGRVIYVDGSFYNLCPGRNLSGTHKATRWQQHTNLHFCLHDSLILYATETY